MTKQNTVQTAPANQGQNQQGQTSNTQVTRPKTSQQLLANIVPMYLCTDRNRRPFGDY